MAGRDRGRVLHHRDDVREYSIAEARHDSGVDLDRIGVAVLNLDGPEWSEARARRTLDRLLGELRGHPSIESASLTGGLPFGVSSALRLSMAPAEQAGAADTPPRMVTAVAATPSIFRTLGVEILRGRGFDDRDGPGAPRVLIVSEFTARQILEPPTPSDGRSRSPASRPRARRPPSSASRPTRTWAASSRIRGRSPTRRSSSIYQPLVTVVTRASGSVPTAVGAMREAIRRADRTSRSTGSTGRTVLAGPFQVMRGFGLTAIGLGAITLLLAMAGLYGIQSNVIANRTREIGVRMSFGATSSQIKRMVLLDGYRPVLDGLLFGLSIGLVGRAIARAPRARRRHRRSLDPGRDANSVSRRRVFRLLPARPPRRGGRSQCGAPGE